MSELFEPSLKLILEFANFPFAIEPANLSLDIEPANWAFVIVPLKFDVKYPVASAKSNAGVASVPPNVKVTPPTDIVEFANLAFAIEPANIALVIPNALTFNASPVISIDVSSTPTLNAVPAPPAKPAPATEVAIWVAVIPASATLTPLAPTDNVEPSASTAKVLATLPS